MKLLLFSVRLYLLALVAFIIVVVAYTFYKKNIVTEPLAVREFPRMPIRNHLGQYKTIDDYKGKTVLVDFWFSTCPPCLDEMKYFPELLDRFDDLVIMSFSIDDESHTLDLLETKPEPWDFIVSDNPRWTFYNVDTKEKSGYVDLLHVTSFPTYFLINEEGVMISSPKSAIYSVEKELGGLMSLRLSFKSLLAAFNFRKILNAFLLFHLMVAFFLPLVIFLGRDRLT